MNMGHAKVLQLNIAGQPQSWLTLEQAANAVVNDKVAWAASEDKFELSGGISRATGMISKLYINSIIAIRGEVNKHNSTGKIVLTNRALFARDRNLCAYCGNIFKRYEELSRDHVVPTSRGGDDVWTNCVTSCRPCNHRKANSVIDGVKWKLLYVPYKPCHSEGLLLQNRNVLADQQEFLMQNIKKSKLS